MFATLNSKIFGLSTHQAHNIRIGTLVALIIWLAYTYIFTLNSNEEGFQRFFAPSPANEKYSTSNLDALPKKIIDFDENPIMNPSPLYEPGTVKYGGTGYVPSYKQLIYNKDYKFKVYPEDLTQLPSYDNKGFCELGSGLVEEKCNALPKGTCASTNC